MHKSQLFRGRCAHLHKSQLVSSACSRGPDFGILIRRFSGPAWVYAGQVSAFMMSQNRNEFRGQKHGPSCRGWAYIYVYYTELKVTTWHIANRCVWIQ